MTILRHLPDLRRLRRTLRTTAAGRRIGFVPTMGALHQGHLALVRAARAATDVVVASIFVNPTQFDDPADLRGYPRDETRDIQLARDAGLDVLFLPPAEEMYPAGHATTVIVGGAAAGLEGERRPGHFDGVALVCLKLFALVEPDCVFLGQKDAQQVAVLRQLVRDTNLPVEIAVVPTVRDDDGLALSSRNARLSSEERRRALVLPQALRAGLAAHREGRDPAASARAALTGVDVDYVAVADFDGEPTLAVAVRVGGIRLIDNVPLDHPDLAGLA